MEDYEKWAMEQSNFYGVFAGILEEHGDSISHEATKKIMDEVSRLERIKEAEEDTDWEDDYGPMWDLPPASERYSGGDQ